MFCWLTLMTGAAFAQTSTGTILGVVTDPSGAAVAGAKIVITEKAKGTVNAYTTDANGQYVAPFLVPGAYSVAVEKEGFQRAVSNEVTLEVDQKARADFQLQVGELSQTLEVTAAPPLVQSDSADLGQVINQRSVEELPLNGRNFAQLVYLVPGVTPGQSGENLSGASTFNPRAASDFNALGSQANANAWLVDGIMDNEYTFNTVMVQPSVESVQEFKVLTGSYGAEFGRGAGVVTTETRSGSNDFHGSLFEFLRNNYMDARSYFNKAGTPQPHYERNQFGGSLGGPIVKNKTFFFGDYYGWREIKGQTFLSTVPTALERQGNFTELNTKIYNPLTGQQFSYNGQSNVINPALFNPVGYAVANLYPLPNVAGAGLFNNYVANLNRNLDDNGGNVRIDQHFNDRDSLFGRYSYELFNLFDTKGQGGCCIPTPAADLTKYNLGPFIAGGQNTTLKASGFALNETHIFTPTLVNEFIAGYSRTDPLTRQSDYGHNAATSLGIMGINLSPNTSGIPTININNSGFGSFTSLNGGPSFLPANPRQTSYQIQDDISWTINRHSLKIGYRIIRDDVSPFTNSNTRGSLTFNNNLTAIPSDPSAGNGLASLLLGYLANGTSSAGSRGFLQSPYYLRVWEHAAWLQDDWKVNDRLTLNLGLRWDLFTPYTEQNNRIANFDVTTLTMLYAGVNASNTADVQMRYRNFGPHVGFAYDFAGNGKTVIRGGYNMSYFPEQTSASNFLGQQFPFAVVQNTLPQPQYATAATLGNFPTINNPFPAIVTPAPAGFTVPQLIKLGNPTVIGQSFQNQTPYYETYTFDVERQMGQNLLAEVAYAGSRGIHLMYCYNPQEVEPGPPSIPSSHRETIPAAGSFRNILQCDPRNSSNYNGLQAKLNRRFSSGIQFLLSYTWSKSLDLGGSAASGGGAVGNPQTITDFAAGYGPSGFDVEHRLVGSFVWDLPFGPTRKFLNHGPVAYVLGAWELGGIVTLQSGTPFTVTLSGACPNGASGCWPDLVGNPNDLGNRTYSNWFDPTAFIEPCNTPEFQGATCKSPAYRYGDAGRGILRNPGLYDADLYIQRMFHFTERASLDLRFEAFNALNHPNLAFTGTVGINGANPAASNTSITSLVTDNRDMEVAAKITF